MKITGKETVYTGHFLRMVHKHFETGSGEKGVWETVERANIKGEVGAVVVVAITGEREVILERNYRVPAESWVLQFPAGLCDVAGESQEETARRELRDETGYQADKLIPIVVSPEASALSPTLVSHFFAPDVKYAGKIKRDAAEEMEILKVPLDKLAGFLLHLPPDTLLEARVPGLLWILEQKGLI